MTAIPWQTLQDGVPIILPDSGIEVFLQPIDPTAFLTNGKLPDFLRPFVERLMDGGNPLEDFTQVIALRQAQILLDEVEKHPDYKGDYTRIAPTIQAVEEGYMRQAQEKPEEVTNLEFVQTVASILIPLTLQFGTLSELRGYLRSRLETLPPITSGSFSDLMRDMRTIYEEYCVLSFMTPQFVRDREEARGNKNAVWAGAFTLKDVQFVYGLNHLALHALVTFSQKQHLPVDPVHQESTGVTQTLGVSEPGELHHEVLTTPAQ